VEAESRRLEDALASAIDDLSGLRARTEIGSVRGEAALLEMRLTMLRDPTLADHCRRRIAEHLVPAEAAVIAEIEEIERGMRDFKQEVLRARAADVRDIGSQVLRKLAAADTGGDTHELANLPPGSVVVAEELLLSDALRMDPVNVVAIVTERTGPASHAAMLARARGIPAVCDIDDATSLLGSGDLLLVDADTGTVTVAPTSTQAKRFALRKSRAETRTTAAIPQGPELPCTTRDGVRIALHANIGRPDEAVVALEHHLDGVGLFRSEFLFLHRETPPDLESQVAAYSEVAALMKPRPVVIRTMDLGGDKLPRFGDAGCEAALRAGLRGLAYSLAEAAMFRIQIRAIVRAARDGAVSVMFPLVMGVADLSEARSWVKEALREEAPETPLGVGAMIETPAAALDIGRILPIVDFVSIGTNDLAHSILAVDRGSRGESSVDAFLHPSVLRATRSVIHAAKQRRTPLSVCGEAACEPAVACLLVGMGVRNLSVNPFLAARVRHAIGAVSLDRMKAVAREVRSAGTRAEVRTVLSAAFRETQT
jgi:phosphoenolpyruvate-protein phosphotransferase